MIDSYALLEIESRIWLQITSLMQDGSTHIRDILA